MALIDFATWWRQFLAEPQVGRAKDGGYGAVKELTRHIASLLPDQRSELVNALAEVACARSQGWGLALGALEKNHNQRALARIASHIPSLKASTDPDDQSALSALLRVLANSPDPGHRDLLAEYLLADPIGMYWSSVPWAVWPADPDLFARGWARYFSATPTQTWRDTAMVQAFLSQPDALVRVRDVLRDLDGTAWEALRDALLRQADAPWLSEEQRQRVRVACRGDD